MKWQAIWISPTVADAPRRNEPHEGMICEIEGYAKLAGQAEFTSRVVKGRKDDAAQLANPWPA